MANDKELRYKLTLQDLFTKKMQSATDSTKKMDGAMSGIGGKIAGMAAGLGIGALAKEMVSTGAKFDSYKAQLEVLLGSQIAASKAFDQVKQDAQKTPFSVDSLMTANTALIGAGESADGARGMVMGLGNALAAMGKGDSELERMAVNLNQIRSIGKASALDIKQFVYAGIPIYQMLSKELGINIDKVKTMDISYEMLQNAFANAAKEGHMFAGGLDKQTQSIGGQLSNLKDQFTNTLVEFYERLKPTIAKIIQGLMGLMSWVSRNKETIIIFGKIALAIGGIVVAVKAWTFASGLATTAMELMTTANAALNLSLGTTLGTVGLLAAGFVALGVAIYGAISSYNEYQDILSGKGRKEAGLNSEIESVNRLAETYVKLGKTREEAMGLAIQKERKNIELDIQQLQGRLLTASDDAKAGIMNVLRDKQGQLSALSDEKGLVSEFAKKKTMASAMSGKTGGVPSSASSGSSTEISATRPQSLVINIHDGLVKQLNVYSQNLKEGSAKIREEVAKVLLEVANDANQAATV